MMMVSTKGRYGLRVMLDVALHQEQHPVALSDIARRQTLSQKYLWQVVNILKKAGFLRSTRGMQGGYVLACEPGEITVRCIVEALEGPVALVECVSAPETCERSADCTAREVWAEIEAKVVAAMDSMTLQDIVQRQKDRAIRGGDNYEI